MEMPKDLKYITATYTVYSDFDVDGMDWEPVEDYYIKHGTLYIVFKSGMEISILPESTEYDSKLPDSYRLHDEEWNEL
jgi:hypothetical protein